MKAKPITPYQRLRDAARKVGSQILHPKKTFLFRYPKDEVKKATGYRLDDLAERVQAAKQLGFEVHLSWDDEQGLVAHYVKKVDVEPIAFIWN